MMTNSHIIDLTHTIDAKSATWNGSCGFCCEIKKDYDKMFRVQKISLHAGIGTHMDAPSHRFSGARSIHEIPPDRLISPLCVLHLTKKCAQDLQVSLEDIHEYEECFGRIEKGSLVIAHTGWSRYWDTNDLYRNVGSDGKMHFPSFSTQAAELLLAREVVGIGIDSLSPDCDGGDYPVHKLFLGADKYIIENIADASHVPAKGAFALALPLKAKDLTECPIRLLALVSRDFN